jgi:DMSO/TMAO reductase YedYZ molybdopterin-dependent catalytic subunit
MSDALTRRKLIRTGLVAAAGVSGLGVAAALTSRYGLIPPNHRGIFGPSETLTYATQRVLIPRNSLAREFNRSEISKFAPVVGEPPTDETYQRLLAGGFAEWRLTVDGLVARPCSFSLGELKRFPSRSQITNHVCEQGWSFIAEWIGVPVVHILDVVGALPEARYVVVIPYENGDPPESGWESIDMVDAWHPQTLLAYGMNGPELPIRHGAPVRLKVPRQMGYKSVKYLRRITVTDTVKNIGKGLGGSNAENGYSWYAGI